MSESRAILLMRQAMPLQDKVLRTRSLIREWLEHFGGMAYVSYSGGLDSTVLLHIARTVDPALPAVFTNTGVEFPENVRQVLGTPNVTALRPLLPHIEVLRRHGYPVVSKRIARYVEEVRRAKGETATKQLRLTGYTSAGKYSPLSKISKKWLRLCEAPFRVSAKCCHCLKTGPLQRYDKTTGRVPIVGTRAEEGSQRTQTYYLTGCNAYGATRPRSAPMSFWTHADVWAYIRSENLRYSELYDMGYERSGCWDCGFGCHLEPKPNRWQRMRQTHPRLWKVGLDSLGWRKVLDWLGWPYESTLPDIEDTGDQT